MLTFRKQLNGSLKLLHSKSENLHWIYWVLLIACQMLTHFFLNFKKWQRFCCQEITTVSQITKIKDKDQTKTNKEQWKHIGAQYSNNLKGNCGSTRSKVLSETPICFLLLPSLYAQKHMADCIFFYDYDMTE